MSVFFDRADALKAYLETVDGLQSLAWVVDRQKNLASELIKATGKKLGLGVITWTGGKNNDRAAKGLRLASRFNVTLFIKPILRGSQPPGDDLAELAARAIHHWPMDANSPTKHLTRFEVTDVDTVDHPELLVIRIAAESVTQLSATPVPIIP